MTSDERIIREYSYRGSVRATERATKYSWNKIVKSLSSNGYVLSETHAEILNKYEMGMTINEIAKEIGLSKKTIQAYLPRVRPVYKENPSRNALNIKKCRERKHL